MKNLHIIPTDKPSYFFISSETNEICRYFKKMDSKSNKVHIYITSDEEIKEGDWILDNLIANKKPIIVTKELLEDGLLKEDKKIILTTDTDLIAEGIQAIDDTFLEWFVKNPSCEKVEVRKWFGGEDFLGYKIIIPQEEPKQETLEEALSQKIQELDNCNLLGGAFQGGYVNGFFNGAKWQQERMYSEEDIMNALHSVELKNNKDYSKIYNSMKEFLNNLKK